VTPVAADKRARRLDKVVTLAELEERRECLEMKKVQQALDQAIGRLDDLLSYRRGYEARPMPFGSVAAVRWQDYQRFLSRLDEAVDSQNRVVLNKQQLLEAHRRRWQDKRKRLGMLGQIRDRYRRAEAERDERQIQKVLDDLKPMERLFDD
jgi:flagellar protein FliJ